MHQGKFINKMGQVDNTHGLVCQRDQAGCHAEESFEEARVAGGGGQERGRGRGRERIRSRVRGRVGIGRG